MQRADEIIPDFTLNDRQLQEGPIISIQQTSIGQCYGQRFDDFKEGWLAFKAYDLTTNEVSRADNVLAFNYQDNTYSVFTFPFNVFGLGRVISTDVWGNNYDLWGDADYAWGSFYESLNALVSLAGDRNGSIYTLGKSNFQYDVDGNKIPVLMDVITKNFNPYIEQGELCRLGYIDLFVSASATTKLHVQFYRDDIMYVQADPHVILGSYQDTTLTFTPTDSMAPTSPQFKVWKRVYVGAVAKEHTIRFYQDADDFADAPNQPVKIHAMVLYVKPAGRIFN